MKILISHNVSKLGRDIPSVSMPVGITCRPDAPCFAKCYARKGNMARPSCKAAYENNLEAYRKDPDFFFRFVSTMSRLSKFFRWHVSGDIVDERYLEGIVQVAKDNPDTKYLCFTKKFDLVNAYAYSHGPFPENLAMVFSGWNKDFKVDNPYGFPVTYVRFKKESNDHIPEDAIPCGGKCYECVACWQLKNGQSIYFDEH